ncbi:hypothetical protein FA15DRAFT_728928 [Coprinopsis marcescibilis]|uniref:C2H2-type domain-containing protein n=1 Tax=Coprinopsis marcescibilis TaxID=230819 RepID=A0A5C3KFP2_COPMA|nr:hypothetical protein FA15DRAFT_728928 [Coprinopsis marcescibilis]
MAYCTNCDKWFATWIGLKEHYVQSPFHHYCQHCNEHFSEREILEDHYERHHHRCKDCNQFFRNELGLHEHHRQSPRHSHLYCVPCRKLFQSTNNLNNHRRSAIHQPKSTICPGRGCGLGFVSTSALALHLESGTCSSGATRSTVNKFVQQYDRNNVITDPARMIGGSFQNEVVTFYATDASWNGRHYECYLCSNGYSSLRGLNQHLASPRHQAKIYICPSSDCTMRFTTLSGFCQHVESERCGLLQSSSQARAIVGGLVSQVRTITM